MDTTTIEISVENYQWLSGQKRPGDSFNDVLDRLRDGSRDEPAADIETRIRDRLDIPEDSIGGDDAVAVAQLIHDGLDRADAFEKRADKRGVNTSTVRSNCTRHTAVNGVDEFEDALEELA
jgi:predicted CopG family antitoxin